VLQERAEWMPPLDAKWASFELASTVAASYRLVVSVMLGTRGIAVPEAVRVGRLIADRMREGFAIGPLIEEDYPIT
jgi:hypothetical protein